MNTAECVIWELCRSCTILVLKSPFPQLVVSQWDLMNNPAEVVVSISSDCTKSSNAIQTCKQFLH
jgi:hypothetical protein